MLPFAPIFAFLSAPPGSWLYQFTFLFVLELALVIAFNHARALPSPAAQRLRLATGGVFISQALYLGWTLGHAAFGWEGQTWLPPLERALLLGLGIVTFWLLWAPKPHRASDALMLGALVFTLLGLGLSWGLRITLLPPLSSYNGTSQEATWAGILLSTFTLCLGALLWRRPSHWIFGVVCFGSWLIGQGLAYQFPLADFDFAGASRLFELVAAPFWLALVYQRTLSAPTQQAAPSTTTLAQTEAQQTELQARLDQAQIELQLALTDLDRQRNLIQTLSDKLAIQARLPQFAASDPSPTAPHTLDDLRAKFQAPPTPPTTDLAALETELDEARQQLIYLDAVEQKLATTTEQAEQARQHIGQLNRELALTRGELMKVSQRPSTLPTVTSVGREAQDVAMVLSALTAAQNKLSDQAVEIADLHATIAERDQMLAHYQQEQPRLRADLELITSLAQELRQPLASVVGYVALMLSESMGIIGTLQRKFLERIKTATERMGVLLDDLLRVMEIDAGHLRLRAEPVEVPQIIEDVWLHSEPLFRERQITLRREIPAALPAIQADREALLQIFTHLITNMGQVSTPNTEAVLSLHTESDARRPHQGPEYLVIAATDTGGGIASEDQMRVFTRVYRADMPLIAGVGDNGFGLSITKALVEAHGGRIWFISEPGQGSTFYVLLPIRGHTTGAQPEPGRV